MEHLKKPEMAKEAERLLADSSWLPEPLRTSDAQVTAVDTGPETGADPLPAFLAQGEDGTTEDATTTDPEEDHSHAIAAE